MIDADAPTVCSCCERTYRRSQVHALGDTGAHICRRCGFYVATRLRGDDLGAHHGD
jgi:hypothetical protein